jgi:hypothetical protein
MLIARHPGDFVSMVRAEKVKSKTNKEESGVNMWRSPSEGVGP